MNPRVSTPCSTADELREFDFSSDDFERVRNLIYARAGISLNASKRNLVYTRLSRRLRTLGLASFSAYLQRLESSQGDEWQNFVNALTTNLTGFFREAHHFPVLAELLRRRSRLEVAPSALWCAAASTGEEPYSMAMLAAETYGCMNPPVRIVATDIDTAVLQTAGRGEYPAESLERLDPALARRYFLRGRGANAGRVLVRPDLRALVTFRPLNLLEPHWRLGRGFDAIFCRNVMIYFDRHTQRRILERFVPLLQPRGLLFAGHSENFHHSRDLFMPCGKTVYEHARAGRAPAP